MMSGVHGGKGGRGGFVPGLLLPAARMHEAAIAEATEPANDPHGSGPAPAALLVAVGDLQALVQAAFDAPGHPVAVNRYRGKQGLVCGRFQPAGYKPAELAFCGAG